MRNIACNLIYNDGEEESFVGFNGRCSIQNIIYNVEKNSERWCNQNDCACYQFYKSNFKRGKTDFPCNESEVFSKWIWSPGSHFKTHEPFIMREVGEEKIAILTTCFANTKESERKIVGFFKIDNVKENGHLIAASRKYRLRLTLDEAKQLDFWSYYRNVKKPGYIIWSQPRFRYLEDIQVSAILHDILAVIQNEEDQSMILNLLQNDFEIYAKKKPAVEGAIMSNNVKKTFLQRKYGKGGESEKHKKLKEYISKNPNEIGLDKNLVTPFIEHLFVSGDLVDILFKSTKTNNDVVVEIELDNVLPGIHQAIKYRALRCSQLGYSLDSEMVKATVVAWYLKDSEKQLCNKYKIDFFEIKL